MSCGPIVGRESARGIERRRAVDSPGEKLRAAVRGARCGAGAREVARPEPRRDAGMSGGQRHQPGRAEHGDEHRGEDEAHEEAPPRRDHRYAQPDREPLRADGQALVLDAVFR